MEKTKSALSVFPSCSPVAIIIPRLASPPQVGASQDVTVETEFGASVAMERTSLPR